jgi:hypothetical protein
MYLQPEPLAAANPKMAGRPAYQYADNTPVVFSDSTGLYRMSSSELSYRPNFTQAIDIALCLFEGVAILWLWGTRRSACRLRRRRLVACFGRGVPACFP